MHYLYIFHKMISVQKIPVKKCIQSVEKVNKRVPSIISRHLRPKSSSIISVLWPCFANANPSSEQIEDLPVPPLPDVTAIILDIEAPFLRSRGNRTVIAPAVLILRFETAMHSKKHLPAECNASCRQWAQTYYYYCTINLGKVKGFLPNLHNFVMLLLFKIYSLYNLYKIFYESIFTPN